MNLLDKPFRPGGSYLCSWGLQSRIAAALHIRGHNTPERQRNALNDELLFGRDSRYHVLPQAYRRSVYFVIDDGWDVPYDTNAEESRAMFGSVIPDEEKFPGYGSTPQEKLATLARKTEALGYAGLGLWISPQIPYETEKTTMDEARAYWSERARWCQAATLCRA